MEQRIKDIEKRVANLEVKLQNQPNEIKKMLDNYFAKLRKNRPTLV